jgi:hypothetical protein
MTGVEPLADRRDASQFSCGDEALAARPRERASRGNAVGNVRAYVVTEPRPCATAFCASWPRPT